jgi:SAM-dependent methyltransferase
VIIGTDIDFGKTASDYGRYRAGFPASLFDRLAEFGIGQPGQRVVDVGTGTGTLARGFAFRGCTVIGIDPAEALLQQAQRLDQGTGVQVDYRVATAEATGLPDDFADVYAAGQCWHWFDRDRAASEAFRVLVAGGAIVLCHFDWLPLPGNIVEATEHLILEHNPEWRFAGGTGFHPEWARDLAVAGFEGIQTFSYDLAVEYTHEAWRGRIRASAGVAASLPPDRVAAFDQAHAALLDDDFPDEPLLVPHRVWAILACRPTGERGRTG